MHAVPVTRGIGEHLAADPRRVVLKRFFPSNVAIAERIVRLVEATPEADATQTLRASMVRFAERHDGLDRRFESRFQEVEATIVKEEGATVTEAQLAALSADKRMLVGCMFMHEYAVEAAALFNPSIVPHPDSPTGEPGQPQRVIITTRSCGEGHISSISFREGVVTADGRVVLEPNATRNLSTGAVRRCLACDWDKEGSPHGAKVATYRNPVTGHEFALGDGIYTVRFDPSVPVSARVLFPQTPEQSNGIEDARFVRLEGDESRPAAYYGTITAYDGKKITPQLIETPDFRTFTLHILEGDIQNKGMALFPRKVGGKFWMLSRQDDVSVLIMSSDSLMRWDKPQVIAAPEQPWEWFKMGNCGSPIETKYGWLVLTHGVGPLRRYCLGALMLDINDPTKVIGRLKNPLLQPNETEREGYVPNVVYTCGAMMAANGTVIVPYAMSDSSSSFASICVDDIAVGMGLKIAPSKM